MAAPDGFKLAAELRDTFLSYLTSALPIGNHQPQRELGRQFYEQWASELFAGPLVEALPAYEKVGSLDHYFGDVRDQNHADFHFAVHMNPGHSWPDIDHRFPQYRRIRDSIWPPHSDDAEEEELQTSISRFWHRSLYAHQWRAFQAIERERRNLIVATATGSGKTECYLIPLLYHLLTESPGIRRTPGIRALLLYPMNALVEDQMHRLRQLLFWINLQARNARRTALDRQITFGRYTGATPVDPNDRDPQRHVSPEALRDLGELAYRSEMQTAPPDILVTNFTMLEYILLRDDDQRLFSHPELFRFLVLDEVHTYSGTQGMEVSLLLRRLKAFLEARSAGRTRFQAIGTSATLPSGNEAQARTADFASTLFGLPFSEQDVLRPDTIRITAPDDFGESERSALFDALSSFPERFPALAQHLGVLENAEATGIPESEWTALAKGVNPTYRPSLELEASSQHVWYRLGELLRDAPVVKFLRRTLTNEAPACLSLHELAISLFGRRNNSEIATTVLLKLVGAAHRDGTPVLSLRFHMFVDEPASAQVCLLPSCGTQSWWSRIYLSHHSHCDNCNSFVYPMLLCRRCGFVYFEGWRRKFPSGHLGPDLFPEPDDADDEATYTRVIFRPLQSSIPEESIASGELRRLCLACGRWMVHENNNLVTNHSCAPELTIIVCAWDRQLQNGALEECVFCEQHWITGRDVATPPAPSVYATATVLVEELERGIERNGVLPFESKLISFSDSRQQAAQLAYRFQKTNREFTFRQLVWHVIQESPNGITSADLIHELYSESRTNHRLRRLILDNETQLQNRALLERTISSLLFRESVTAYLTLEAQGIVKLGYDPALFRDVTRVLQRDRLLFARLSEQEQASFLSFLLDWNMRFRFAIAPPQGGSDVDWHWLEERYINAKQCVRSKADGLRGELNFAVSMATKANRAFNFCKRVYARVNNDRFRPEFSVTDLQRVLFSLWDEVLLPYSAQRNTSDEISIFNIGRGDPEGAVIKINFDSLSWSQIPEDATLFRCDACGRISSYSIAGVCPLRDCTGTLQPVTGTAIDNERFSPVRHYRRLVRQRSVRPLRVEEHTAQVAAGKRQAIERDFRRTDDDSVDVICGSTTFELGIDLGTIHAVFMSNLPPRISNYRQRAGRAGRRAGMVPFILSYVRQRPHDQYFWKRLSEFIAGPVPVPHLSLSSQEVISRHANALFVRELIRDHSQQTGQRAPLDGPPSGTFVSSVLTNRQLDRLGESLTNTAGTLRREYESAFASLTGANRPVAAAAQLRERLSTLEATYLPLRARDGAISVFSDYGILPSYAFPLYVDEMRLNREPSDRPPRSDLKLQRDRRIALQEYMPGKIIVAGKTLIASRGLWSGSSERQFRVCSNRECQVMDFSENAPSVCPSCGSERQTFTAVVPRGGFFGDTVESVAEQDEDLTRQRGETYFDPANEPPPEYRQCGHSLEVAIVGSRVMEQSSYRPRMRQLNPRPHSNLVLEMVPSRETDLALPNLPASPCLKRAQPNENGRRFHLMHEFTTDIIRVRVVNDDIGRRLAATPEFLRILDANPDRTRQRFYWDCLRRTLGEALVTAASQVLDIDSSELGVAFHTANQHIGGKEFIFFDTAPGGAGYARQFAEQMQAVFQRAEELASTCDCGDSCYGCIRTYGNQAFHKRLNRHFILAGLHEFNRRNWAAPARA